MLAPTLQEYNERTETNEFIEMLKNMTEKEKQQVKGIMIGIQLSKLDMPKKTA